MHDVLSKDHLRQSFLKKRKALNKNYVLKSSVDLRFAIKKFNISAYENIMFYISHDNEIPMYDVITYVCKDNSSYVPYVNEHDELVPARIYSGSEYVKGRYNISIPKELEIVDNKIIDLVFVPGIVFDKEGYRIGYGKGYYDRFLNYSSPVKIGCCYSWQIIDKITCCESHDVKMDYLLTENDLIKLL